VPKLKKVAIATPTFNEAKNIPALITTVAEVCKNFPGIDFTLLVIDDNSPDKTADVAERTAQHIKLPNFRVQLLRRKLKDGFGKAYVNGFDILLAQPFDYIIQMDADLSHSPTYLRDFIAAAKAGHDFVVASRYLKGGGTPDWSLHRKLLSRSGNLYSRLFLGSTITDYTGGYNMFAKSLLKKIDTNTLSAGGYGFLIELKYRALQQAQSTIQIPIIFHDRQHGESKIPKSTLIKNFILVPRIRFKKNSY